VQQGGCCSTAAAVLLSSALVQQLEGSMLRLMQQLISMLVNGSSSVA
jgi:hypothetical protein